MIINDEEIEKPMQISWDNVPLNSNKVGHLEILCVKWRKNADLGEHCKDSLCACLVLYAPFPLNLICNMTTFRFFFFTFDPTPGVKCVRTEYVLAWCYMLHFLLI